MAEEARVFFLRKRRERAEDTERRALLEGLVRLAARTGVGLAALWALSGVGGLVGLHLGVNLVNALVLGVLGVPGFGLLLMLNWALAV